MKIRFVTLAVFLAVTSCSSPSPLTANPDDATSTPGTTGSSRMTNEMPRKPQGDDRRQSDTAVGKRDSLPKSRP